MSALMASVRCTQCGSVDVLIPRTAPDMMAFALCPSCADSQAELDQAEATIRAAAAAERVQKITSEWSSARPEYLDDITIPPHDDERLSNAATHRAALIVYGQDAPTRSAYLWNYCRYLGAQGLSYSKVGGGSESETLALATNSDFSRMQSVRDRYISDSYKAVMLDGIGEGRFLSQERRYEEYTQLARKMLRRSQLPIFSVKGSLPSSLASAEDKATPFNPWGDPQLVTRIGDTSASLFTQLLRTLSSALIIEAA